MLIFNKLLKIRLFSFQRIHCICKIILKNILQSDMDIFFLNFGLTSKNASKTWKFAQQKNKQKNKKLKKQFVSFR
jgi:hypothetical protein